jgi:hypothetical protein
MHGDVMMKPIIAAALSLLGAITPAITQPADVALRFDCSAFTHILSSCRPPSSARDPADAMASAFMSGGIQLGREGNISDGKLNAVAMAALQCQRAKTGNTCSRLDVLVRNYGRVCDALIDSHRADMESAEASAPSRCRPCAPRIPTSFQVGVIARIRPSWSASARRPTFAS